MTLVSPVAMNIGIVPPWLAGAGDGTATQPVGVEAQRAAAIILGDSGEVVIISDRRKASEASRGAAEQSRPSTAMRPELAVEQAKAAAIIRDIQGFFGELGFTESEGNDNRYQVKVLDRDPRDPSRPFNNASFTKRPAHTDDLIHVGQSDSGAWFTEAPDVLAHEYAHRMIGSLTDLKSWGEDGAINESLADTFAAAYDTKDWAIGEGAGHPVRTMDKPELDKLPGHMRDFDDMGFDVERFERALASGDRERIGRAIAVGQQLDFGGVHINAGIPNKAAALIGDAVGRDKMAKIYMHAVKNHVDSGEGIVGLAESTAMSAAQLFGKNSNEFAATVDAWKAVGALRSK